MVSPGQVQRTPTLFGKNGLFSPWFAGIAGSVLGYFRLMHSEAASLYLLVPLKVTPILMLVTMAFQLIGHGASAKYTYRIGAGLAFSAAGDVFLEVEGGRQAFFLSGLVSFLVGHLAYIGAFSIGLRRSDILPLAIGSMAAYALGMFLFLMPHLPAALLGPVAVYAAVIAAMAVCALSRPAPTTSHKGRWSKMSGVVGALTFVVSDSVLAVNKFAFPVPAGKDIVMVTYYLGQIGITLSIWGTRSDAAQAADAAVAADAAAGNAMLAAKAAAGPAARKKTRKAD